MKTLLILLCKHHNQVNDGDANKYIFTFLASLSVALIVIIINYRLESNKLKKQKKEKLRNEIYVLCEKIIRYALHSSQRELAAKYFYSMHKADKDEDFDKINYFKYLSDAESSALSCTLCRADLIAKIGELENCRMNPNEIKEIKEAMISCDNTIIKRADGVFTKEMDKNEIAKIYKHEMDGLPDYVRNNSCGKHLIKIQKIMYPNIGKV
ncbi:MAG: hypothetical protein ACYDCN_07915 [Bacteroidia bacterium]